MTYTVFQKSDAKIQITITTAYLIRIKYSLSSFNYHLSDVNVANFNNPPHSFGATAVLKMELKNRSFQYGKVALAVRIQKHQLGLQFVLKVTAVCTDTRVVEHATVELLGHMYDVLVEATPLLDETLFQVVDVANPAMVDALLEHTS